MTFNSKLSCAVAAILSGTSAASVQAATGSDTDTNSDTIQEITVTAQRRVENMQDVPITIQALTAETLTQLNVLTFDDFIKYLPNVTSASSGPGQGPLYHARPVDDAARHPGVGRQSAAFPTSRSTSMISPAPLPGRNLDIYAADLERIEVLEGPQGTLFGAGAESGVLRYITNKPKLDVTEGNVNAGYEYTAHGDPSSNVHAVINLPLIAGHARGARRDLQRFARRLHQQRAGYLCPPVHRHRHPLRRTSTTFPGRRTAAEQLGQQQQPGRRTPSIP